MGATTYISQGTYNGVPYVYKQLKSAAEIQANVMADAAVLGITFMPIGKNEVCPEGTYKVALVMDLTDDPSCPNETRIETLNDVYTAIEIPDMDFHWYRQNSDGTWSHKRGLTNISCLDESGQVIYDPQMCDRSYDDANINYSVFVGYYAVSGYNPGSN